MTTKAVNRAGRTGRNRLVRTSQVARRTGLADSGVSMAALCGRTGVAVEDLRSQSYVALEAFAAAPTSVLLDDVVELERGVLL